MQMMENATLDGQSISINDAIDLRDRSDIKPEFRCIECGNRVRAHRAGGHASAHFEHLERNSDCTLSHIAR